MNRLSLQLIIIMTAIILIAQMFILIPSLSQFHRDEMLEEAKRQLYLHQVAMLQGEQAGDLGFVSEIIPSPDKPRITLTDLNDQPMPAYFNNDDPTPIPEHQSSTSISHAFTGLMGWQTAPYAMDFKLDELSKDDEELIKLGANIADIGVVTLIAPPNFITASIRDYFWRITILVFALVLLVSLPFGIVVEWLVVKPLKRLIESVSNFAKSPFNSAPEWQNTDDSIIDEAYSAVVSLQHRTQYELTQREKMLELGYAVAKINHDMRNVLASAVLVSDRLTESNDPRVTQAAPLVNGAIERAIILCKQLLAYISTPNNINIERMNMPDLIDECRRQLDLDIQYDGPHDLYVDKDQFFRLIFNLLDNAKKATATMISITVWQTGRSTVIDISDNGPCLDKTAQANLFKPFKSGRTGATGIGLSIARDIAHAHNGDLRLSRTSQSGTEFRLRLAHHVIKDEAKKRWWF
ncbi:MAG: HAMP domain-containing histidine kinase [Alphaproteobacteria bacterium]|nr:HAMP domain-containing histidine kinase [Alphaproteobacteria bacterium]